MNKSYSKIDLKEVLDILRDFCIPEEEYREIPENIKTISQLHNWEMRLINAHL